MALSLTVMCNRGVKAVLDRTRYKGIHNKRGISRFRISAAEFGNNSTSRVDVMSDNIRLRYPGFVLFLSRLISVGTGLIFSLIVVRNVSVEEFGIYGNMGDTVSYFTFLSTVIPFWAMRFVARRHAGSSKTGLMANLILSVISAVLYLLLLPLIMEGLKIPKGYTLVYAFLSLQIIEAYAYSAFTFILRARRPQVVGYGFLIFEICKVILVLVFIPILHMGLLGAVLSVVFARLLEFTLYLKLMADDLRERVVWSYVREWVKASFVNVYNIAGQWIISFAPILLFMYSGGYARAYYGAALTITNIIGYSSLLAFSLYPRLLSQSNSSDVTASLRTVLMFAIPMTFGAITLSGSYLIILKPDYVVAKPILILLALSAFCITLSNVFHAVVAGTEQFDAEAKIPVKKLVRSRLFLLFTVPHVRGIALVSLTYITLSFMAGTPYEAAFLLAAVNVVASIVTMLMKYAIARRGLPFSMPWGGIAKYLLSSVVMALVLYVIPPPSRLSLTLAVTLLGGVIYFSILWFIDEEARRLSRSMFRIASQMVRGRGPTL